MLRFTARVLTLSPPTPPPDLPPPRFPVLLTVLPLGGAVLVSLWFRHPLALALGVLGSVMALAHYLEQRRSHRRQAEQNRLQAEDAWVEYQRRRDEHARNWLARRRRAHPAVADWLLLPVWQPPRGHSPVLFRVGRATEAVPGVSADDPLWVADAPLVVECHRECVVVGDSSVARALYRSLAVQLFAACSTESDQRLPPSLWPPGEDLPPEIEVSISVSQQVVRLRRCRLVGEVPLGADLVILSRDAETAELLRPGEAPQLFSPEGITEAQAMWCRERLWQTSTDAEILEVEDESDRGALWCQWSDATVPFDLVTEGPHLLVWGQTGSGKSVALQRLIASLAARYSPAQVTVVFCDFKGGASLVTLRGLPHLVGVATDLTEDTGRRATVSIRAEMRRREALLAEHGVSDLSDLPLRVPCPRTLLIVDEVHALLQVLPEMGDVLSDVASRGRSLGIHLVVSGQRMSGVVPRAVLANAPARLCLRVTDPAEAAEGLPGVTRSLVQTLATAPRGTALFQGLRWGISPVTPVPVLSPEIDDSVTRWAGVEGEAWWAPELPLHIDSSGPLSRKLSITPETVAVLDEPEWQRQVPWHYDPKQRGSLWVVGEDGSGHSTLVRRFCEAGRSRDAELVMLPDSPEGLWWTLRGLLVEPPGRRGSQWVLSDRIDRVLSSLTEEQFHRVIECLALLAHRSPEIGVIVTSGPAGAVARALRRHFSQRVLLSHRSLEDWLSVGGVKVLWSPERPPGRFVWHDTMGQVVMPSAEESVPASRPVGVSLSDLLSRSPGQRALIATERPEWWSDEQFLVMSPRMAGESWQRIQELLDSGLLVFASGDPAEMRQIVGPRVEVPAVPARQPHLWAYEQGQLQLVVC